MNEEKLKKLDLKILEECIKNDQEDYDEGYMTPDGAAYHEDVSALLEEIKTRNGIIKWFRNLVSLGYITKQQAQIWFGGTRHNMNNDVDRFFYEYINKSGEFDV